MKLGVTIPVEEGLTLPQLTALARAAEDGGYHTVLAGEVAGPDVFALLAAVSSSLTRARLGTGIVPMTTRSLPLLAMGFASLASLAPGRVLAGLGIGSRTVVEDWHGGALPPAVAFTREFVPAFRRLLAGERVDVDGEHVRVRGFRLGLPPAEPVPVMLAAMNPRMLRLAGELADAVQLTWCPPEEVPALVTAVREGARAAGRDPGEVEVVASFFGYGGPRTRRRRASATGATSSPTRSSRRTAPPSPARSRAWTRSTRSGPRATAPAHLRSSTTPRSSASQRWEPTPSPNGPGSSTKRASTCPWCCRPARPRATTTGRWRRWSGWRRRASCVTRPASTGMIEPVTRRPSSDASQTQAREMSLRLEQRRQQVVLGEDLLVLVLREPAIRPRARSASGCPGRDRRGPSPGRSR